MYGCRYQVEIWWLMVKIQHGQVRLLFKERSGPNLCCCPLGWDSQRFCPALHNQLGPVAVCVGLFDKIKVINSHFLVIYNHLKLGQEFRTRVELMIICLALKWLGVLCLEPITLRMTSPAEQKQFKIVQVKSLLLAALHGPKIRPGLGASG